MNILNPRMVVINGVTVTLGRCPCCGRNLRQSRLNKLGARCHYEGTQFDRSGHELFNLMMLPQEIRARRAKAREVYRLYPTQAIQIISHK